VSHMHHDFHRIAVVKGREAGLVDVVGTESELVMVPRIEVGVGTGVGREVEEWSSWVEGGIGLVACNLAVEGSDAGLGCIVVEEDIGLVDGKLAVVGSHLVGVLHLRSNRCLTS
jgi:hypothetical protein